MKTYTRAEVAATIDHAVLKPDITTKELEQHAQMCIREKTASLCVRPCDIAAAAQMLKNTGVMVSCVLSFPHGADVTPIKVLQARQAIADGANEIDMVMNIGRFLDYNYEYVVKEIRAVADIAHADGVTLKVIQESGYFELDRVEDACELSFLGGADYVKTSTGFGPGGATPEIIDIMLRPIGNGRIKVKASGGIRTWSDAVAYLRQGVHRLGTGSTEAILAGSGEPLESMK